MGITDEIKDEMGAQWLPTIYDEKVRQDRTRAYSLDIPQHENQAEIMHTLLGIELKIGRKRFSCPDLATARYLRIFARAGCREVAVPYDITRISCIADELETSWQRMLLIVSTRALPQNLRRLRTQLVKAVRLEIADIGPGDKMPEFNQSTVQRDS